jgi:hypothetical protein
MKSIARALGALLAVLCLWSTGGAHAEPITYTVTASFTNNGTASGHFTFDADTLTYSNIDITVTGSTNGALNGTYSFLCPIADCPSVPANAHRLLVLLNPPSPDLTAQPVFRLNYNQPLTDAGGSVKALTNSGFCAQATCTSVQSGAHVDGGGIVAMLIPVPTLTGWGVGIFSLLLCGLAAARLTGCVGSPPMSANA